MAKTKKQKRSPLPVRGYQLHVTHYDPAWCKVKEKERPFDKETAFAALECMAEAEMNLLVLDCADGVEYRSHPELKRHYSVPMADAAAVADRARELGIEVVPKLNFAQSAWHQHNHWFRPHHRLFDNEEYWAKAFELIDELCAALQPERYFHIGMDEDHDRGLALYVKAIKTLRSGLKERGLRPIIWNDAACAWPEAETHREKSLHAVEKLPKDVVHVLWDYSGAKMKELKRIREAGFPLWGAPGRDTALVRKMVKALQKVGGRGVLITRWKPCTPDQRQEIEAHIRLVGPVCAES
jgi:hypothetical protein